MAACRGLDVLLGAAPAAGCAGRCRPALTVAAHTYTVTALSRREVTGADRGAAGRDAGRHRGGRGRAQSPPRSRPRGGVRGAARRPRSPAGTPPGTARAQARVARRARRRPRVRAAVGAGITALPALQGALTARAGAAGRRRRWSPPAAPARPPAAREGWRHRHDRRLRFGYGTNGFANHRLDDALAVIADLGYDGRRAHPRPRPPRPVRARTWPAGSPPSPTGSPSCGLGGGRRDRRPLPARPVAQARADAAARRPRSRGWTSCAGPSRSAPTWAPRRCRSGPASARPRVDRGRRLGPAGRRLRRRSSTPPTPRASPLGLRARAGHAGRGHRGLASGCAPRSARRPAFGITLDIGHCRCLEPMPVPDCVAAVADAPGQRADRRHAPGRARAPGVRRRRDRLPAGAARAGRRPATAAWSPSSCPATRTPRRPWPRARWTSCARAAEAAELLA